MELSINANRKGPEGGRRMVVNGKLLTYKQTAQFEKFMQDEDFRTRFIQLAEEIK